MPDISPVGHSPASPIDRFAQSGGRRDDNGLSTLHDLRQPPERPGDRVELSEHARFLGELRKLPDARLDRVARIREEIQDGTYATNEKLDVALDRLLEDLF